VDVISPFVHFATSLTAKMKEAIQRIFVLLTYRRRSTKWTITCFTNS